ncbi:MAG: hypothetical protein LIO65_04060 [Odoribacter sp.]|nr:hypothetical protein [Odoribacter sp.]
MAVVKHGGIRIKSIVSTTRGTRDVINYRYPEYGTTLYPEISSLIYISYKNVTDLVESTNVFYEGLVLENLGNEGLYYDYVEEEMAGKGFNTYLHFIPVNRVLKERVPTPYWLCGLPLAQASYDVNGNLVYLKKNRYYSEREPFLATGQDKWIEDAPASICYSK